MGVQLTQLGQGVDMITEDYSYRIPRLLNIIWHIRMLL
jgi:hypothetical protein